jgi:hypothetical protein
MRKILLAALLIAAPATYATAGVGPFKGNDAGGIIAWSPANQRAARLIAVEHCARYGKLARITSVWARYGQYIGFSCRLPHSYAVGYRHRSQTVLHARF